MIALFEAIIFSVCFITYIISDTNSGGYTLQEVTVIGYYIALHLCFLLLHNALGKRDEFEGTHKHVGITLKSCTVMSIFMLLFLAFVTAIVIVQVQ